MGGGGARVLTCLKEVCLALLQKWEEAQKEVDAQKVK